MFTVVLFSLDHIDVTGGFTQLNLQGPRSRELMQALTDTDMSNEAFPFRTMKDIAIVVSTDTSVIIL